MLGKPIASTSKLPPPVPPTSVNIGEYSVAIVIEGAEQPCYHVETSEDGKTVECWIASEVGKHFAIHYVYGDTPACFNLCLDGHWATTFPCNIPGDKSERRKAVRRVWTSESKKSPLLFQNDDLTDDDDFFDSTAVTDPRSTTTQALPSSLSRKNSVGIRFQRVNFERGSKKDKKSVAEHIGNAKVHERTKKGLVHGIGLGEEEDAEPSVSSHYRPHVVEDLATFIFCYTARDILQARGIIPDSAARRPILPDPDEDDDEIIILPGPSKPAVSVPGTLLPTPETTPIPPFLPPPSVQRIPDVAEPKPMDPRRASGRHSSSALAPEGPPRIKKETRPLIKEEVQGERRVKEEVGDVKKPESASPEFDIVDVDALEQEVIMLRKRVQELERARYPSPDTKTSIKREADALEAQRVSRKVKRQKVEPSLKGPSEVIDLTLD